MRDHPEYSRNISHPSCHGKHAYASAQLAWRVVRREKPRRTALGRRAIRTLDVYKCPGCGRWHIGKAFRSMRAFLKWGD